MSEEKLRSEARRYGLRIEGDELWVFAYKPGGLHYLSIKNPTQMHVKVEVGVYEIAASVEGPGGIVYVGLPLSGCGIDVGNAGALVAHVGSALQHAIRHRTGELDLLAFVQESIEDFKKKSH